MLFDGDVLGFVVVAIVVVLAPGPDMALVTSHAITGGVDNAKRAALGVNAGILVHASAAALGISALLMASSMAYTIVKVVGAAFLVYLGVRMLLAIRHRDATQHIVSPFPTLSLGRSPFWQGFWSNVLNPKVAILFLSLLPQFVEPGDPVLAKTLLLSGIFLAMGLAWLLTFAALMSRLAGVMRSDAVRRRLEAVTGAVLIILGVRVVTQDV
jgi:threonine/homoserine/homoserine lactone efflux protein